MILIKPLLFYVLAAVLALVLMVNLPYGQAYWLLLSVLAAFYLANTQIIPQIKPAFIVVGLGIALLIFLSGYLAHFKFWQAGFLIVVLLITVGVGVWQPRFWRSVLVTNYLLMLAAALGADNQAMLQRSGFVLAGFLLVASMRWLCFHKTTVRQLKWACADSLMKAADLSDSIFSVYLTRDYQQQLFVYEKKLHWERNAFLKSLATVRELLTSFNNGKRPGYTKLLQNLEQIYEVLLSIGLLVYRVSDHSTFEVANKEFIALAEAIKVYLKALAMQLQKGELAASTTFTDAIQEFQDINHDALQIVAPDPTVFVLLSEDFYALNQIFTQLVEVMDETRRA